MPIVDDQGRMFGRLNLVDAAIGALVLVLLPAAYGAYVLFRDPQPKLTAVLPGKLQQGPNLQVEVHGENLRPYMRVSFNDLQGRAFFFASATTAVVPLPDVPPGQYDVVLYDYMQEVSRLPKALTIEPSPAPVGIIVEISGVLTSLNADQVKKVEPGHKFPETGGGAEVLAVGAPEPEVLHIKTGDKATLTVPVDGPLQLPLRLRTSCAVQTTTDGALRCTVAGIPLAPDANVQYAGLGTQLNFRVSEVHFPGRSRMATVHARFLMSPEVRVKIKAADRDVGAAAHPAGQMATLVSLADRGDAGSSGLRDDRVRQAIPGSKLVAIDAVLSVPVEESPLGWLYKGSLVKIGAPLSFETPTYTIDGGVTDVNVPDAPSTKAVVPAAR
jgi:hypothetical protein